MSSTNPKCMRGLSEDGFSSGFKYGDGRYTCSNISTVVAPSAFMDTTLAISGGKYRYSPRTSSPDSTALRRRAFSVMAAAMPPSTTKMKRSTPGSAGPEHAPSGILTRHIVNNAPFICGEARYAPEHLGSHPGSPHHTRDSGVMTAWSGSFLLRVRPGSPSPRGLGCVTSGYPVRASSTLGLLDAIRSVTSSTRDSARLLGVTRPHAREPSERSLNTLSCRPSYDHLREIL